MKRKSEFVNALDEMFCEDHKRRLKAVKLIRDIASAIGPGRVRT